MTDGICNICGSKSRRGYLEFKDKGREVVVCGGCKTARTFPYSDIDYKEQEFYCEHYIKNEDLFRGFAKDMVGIVKRYKDSGRLLDIGCAVGFLLEEAKNSGFEAHGIELNEKAAAFTSAKGFDVRRSQLKSAGYGENSFDVVILNHVLEHIILPNTFLQEIRPVLKEDGLVVIGVPNHDSLVAGLYGTRWYGWGMPEHIWHFDRNSLESLLLKNNFKIKGLVRNSQHYAFSKSLRKNTMAVVARAGNALGAGDQLIALAGK